ncbi:hypothetical protein N8589_02935, partial [Akkermansiaceae bacterium]|nr:hypothetical protein [Akkermansiaceae bacterium]
MSTSKSRCILSLICHPIDMLKLVSLLTITLFLQAQAYRDPIRLTHGPMLGKPTSSSVAVWGRTSEPGEF